MKQTSVSSPLALGIQTPRSRHLLHGGDRSWHRNAAGAPQCVQSWPSNSLSTDGNYSSVINAMKGLQQTHRLLLWAQSEQVSVLPEATCFQTSPVSPRQVTLGWRPEIWRGLGAAAVFGSAGAAEACGGAQQTSVL